MFCVTNKTHTNIFLLIYTIYVLFIGCILDFNCFSEWVMFPLYFQIKNLISFGTCTLRLFIHLTFCHFRRSSFKEAKFWYKKRIKITYWAFKFRKMIAMCCVKKYFSILIIYCILVKVCTLLYIYIENK